MTMFLRTMGVIPLQTEYKKPEPIVNTPIEDIRAKMKAFDNDIDIPNFLCYKFDVITPVRNQGSVCGTCWAFVVAEIIGDRISVQKNRPIILSPQGLIQCFDFPKGCQGASPERVFEWMEKTNYKLPFEFDLPYRQERSSTMSGICPNLRGVNIKENSIARLTDPLPDHVFVKNTASEQEKKTLSNNIQNMKKELILEGPFFATIKVYDDLLSHIDDKPYFSNFKGTVVGGHAIEIVGYCEPGVDLRKNFEKGYWICKNTWGVTWPPKSKTPGYFTIAMGVNMCGVESRCASVEPDIDIKPLQGDVAYTNWKKYAAEFIV